MSVPIDQPLRLTFTTYSDAAQTVPADPTTVSVDILDPTGVTTTYTWAGAQVVRDATGVFHLDYTPATAGHYALHWKATGAVTTSLDGSFDVEPKYGAWVTLTDAKVHLDITTSGNDDELQDVINAAVGILEDHPDYRVRDAVTATDYTEWYDGGVGTIVLKHYPVLTVTTVAEYTPTLQALAAEPLDTTSAFTGYGYTLDVDTGIISRTTGGSSTQFAGRVKVVYTAGSGTVPAPIRDAALELVRHLWETQRGNSTGRPVPGYDQETPQTLAGYLLPHRVTEALEPYRKAPKVA